MNTAEILDLKKILSTPKKVVIVPHKNPDGDAMGSTLGLYDFLAFVPFGGGDWNDSMQPVSHHT